MKVGGVSDVAEELNISKQALAKLRERGDFPDPLGQTSGGPVWNLESIRSWAASPSRVRPGRPSMELLQRRVGDRFEIEGDAIGSGGYGNVYRARDGKDGSMVALKILTDTASEITQIRFVREADMLKRLHHPNIVQVIDTGSDFQGSPWYAMPLAAGSLHDLLSSFAGNEAKIIDVMRQICAGVQHIHESGMIHRDLKPANVLRVGPTGWAIADFGLARDGQQDEARLTSTNMAFGTPYYMAPEQMMGAKHVEPTADTYSLGRILHALVVGNHPISPDIPSTIFKHIIITATRGKPEDRYQSVADLAEDIEAIAAARESEFESVGEKITRFSEQIKSERPDNRVLREFLSFALTIGDDTAILGDMIALVPQISTQGIESLLEDDRQGFIELVDSYNRAILGYNRIQFSFCDVIADFYMRAVNISDDADILKVATYGLAEMGCRHNRWYARDRLVELLQKITAPQKALEALAGLRQASSSAVEWSLGGFATRTLHPVLRSGVEKRLAKNIA